jgi:hypothetical protein
LSKNPSELTFIDLLHVKLPFPTLGQPSGAQPKMDSPVVAFATGLPIFSKSIGFNLHSYNIVE